MIIMVVSDSPEKERLRIVDLARAQAAYHTDEQWRFIESGSVPELVSSVADADKVDMICLDLTMEGALAMAERLRSEYASAYLTLIADAGISPVRYIRPSIHADSLMIKPLDDPQIEAVMGEAVSSYTRRFDDSHSGDVFIAENKGERNLIEYSRILFFEAREKKVFLSTEREEYGFYDTLDELERRLDDRFLRCHRSYIVNARRIVRVEISASRVIMDDGTEVPLSRSFKPAVKEYLNRRKGNGDR